MKRLAWFFTAVLAGVYITRPVADPDLWWHLTIGRWILSRWTVPATDLWSMFGVGMNWRAYSWSNEVVYAAVERYLGITGIAVFHFVLGSALTLSLFYCLGRISRDWFFGSIAGLVAVAGCLEHFSLRPQTFTWVLLVWLIFVSDRILEEGASAKRLAGVFAVMCIWANTHITTLLGLVVACAWVFDFRHPLKTLPVLAAGVIGTLVTPYLGGEWLTFSATVNHPLSFTSIAEFQPANILHYATGFLVLLLVLLVAFLQRAPKALSASQLLTACVFVLGALAVVKFIPFASIILASLTAKTWRQSASLGSYGEAFEKLHSLVSRLYGQGFAFVLLCLIIVYALPVLRYPVNTIVIPVPAVEFMKSHDLPHPYMNDFNGGGYLMYAFSNPDGTPQYLVTIDGRTNLISKDLWEAHNAAFAGRPDWRRFFEMVRPESIIWPNESPLGTILEADGEWCRAFNSGEKMKGFSVFIKRTLAESRSEENLCP